MIVRCPSCATRYDIADHLQGSSSFTVSCRSCGHSWKEHAVVDVVEVPSRSVARVFDYREEPEFDVQRLVEAAKNGDFFITVTGNRDIINREHFVLMKSGAIMCNAGHFDVEVNVTQLKELAVAERIARTNIVEYTLPSGQLLYLLAEGRLVNLAAGDGHPAEVMDMTFALQALSLQYVALNYEKLSPVVYQVNTEIDEKVAMLKLQSLGLSIDQLTEEQVGYLASWSSEEA